MLWKFPDWGCLCAIASIHLLACFRIKPTKGGHWGFRYAAVVALDAAVAAMMIVASRSAVLGFLLAATPIGLWILISIGFWWLAPTFMAQREGAIPMLPPFPVRSLRGPALLAIGIGLRGLLIASFGFVVALIYDVCVVTLLQLLALLEEDVARPRHQA